MVKGRLDKTATTATSYAWLVWEKKAAPAHPRLMWIPPCRKRLERATDYEQGRGLATISPTINRKRPTLISA
jgi:hypothetical protein